ncbi:MAG: hypothetical protein FWC13_07570 [Oscillospiraceae bacterium]|nr:hypothetical protein [Oscillospiraceae bacterium]
MANYNESLAEKLFFGVYDDISHNPEEEFYHDRLIESIHSIAGTKYIEFSITSHFENIVEPMSRAIRMQGFKLGFSLAFKLMLETNGAHEKEISQVEDEYRRYSTPLKKKQSGGTL